MNEHVICKKHHLTRNNHGDRNRNRNLKGLFCFQKRHTCWFIHGLFCFQKRHTCWFIEIIMAMEIGIGIGKVSFVLERDIRVGSYMFVLKYIYVCFEKRRIYKHGIGKTRGLFCFEKRHIRWFIHVCFEKRHTWWFIHVCFDKKRINTHGIGKTQGFFCFKKKHACLSIHVCFDIHVCDEKRRLHAHGVGRTHSISFQNNPFVKRPMSMHS